MKRSVNFLRLLLITSIFCVWIFPLFIISLAFMYDRQAQILLFFNCFENFPSFRQKFSNRFIELHTKSDCWIDHSLRIDAVIKMTMCDKRAIMPRKNFTRENYGLNIQWKFLLKMFAFFDGLFKVSFTAGHRWLFFSQFKGKFKKKLISFIAKNLKSTNLLKYFNFLLKKLMQQKKIHDRKLSFTSKNNSRLFSHVCSSTNFVVLFVPEVIIVRWIMKCFCVGE